MRADTDPSSKPHMEIVTHRPSHQDNENGDVTLRPSCQVKNRQPGC